MTPPFTVYRFWDSEDRLLYVGRTINLAQRVAAHNSRSWFGDVVKITVERFTTYEEMLRAEFGAINKESPLYNVTPMEAGKRSGAARRRLRQEAHARGLDCCRKDCKSCRERWPLSAEVA